MIVALAAAAACDRPREQLWSAKAVRVRPGREVKAKKVVKEEVVAGGEENADKKAEEDLKPKIIEQLKAMKAARDAQDVDAEMKAIDALKALEREKVVTPIRDITLSNAENLGEMALRVVGHFKDPELLVLLTKPLKGSDVYMAGAAAWAIGEIGKSTLNGQLVAVLGSEERPTSARVEASLALGKIGNKGAVEPLLDALKSDNEELSVAAAVALGMLKDLRALNPLRAKLAEVQGKDPELELELAKTLMVYFNDLDAPAVVAERLIGGTQVTRRKALDVLAKHENRREVGRLVVDLLADNPGNTFEIVESMQQLCTGEEDCILLLKQKKKEVKGGPAVNACDQAIADLRATRAANKVNSDQDDAADAAAAEAAGGKKKKKKKKRKKKRRR